jgi:hypothetical protein
VMQGMMDGGMGEWGLRVNKADLRQIDGS